jgi:transposase
MKELWGSAPRRSRNKSYSESFKRKVVYEVRTGQINKDEARRRYNIPGKSTVLNWCRQYGKVKEIPEESVADKEELLKELEQLKKENNRLQQDLENAELKAFAYEKLIEVAEKRLGVEIKKKIGEKP